MFSPPSPSKPLALDVAEAKYVLLRPLTFVSMEAVDVDVSSLSRPFIGSGDEYTVAGVSGTAEDREEDDMDVEIEADADPEVEKETVVEEKLVLRGMRSREDDRLKGGLGGG